MSGEIVLDPATVEDVTKSLRGIGSSVGKADDDAAAAVTAAAQAPLPEGTTAGPEIAFVEGVMKAQSAVLESAEKSLTDSAGVLEKWSAETQEIQNAGAGDINGGG